MVFSPSITASFTALLPSAFSRDRVYFGFSNSTSFFHSAPSTSHFSAITLSRRQKLNSVITAAKKKKPTTSTKKTTKKKKQVVSDEEDELDEDAFEALFKQLEEDLKNDDLSLDFSDDDITEEEFAQFERELKEALGDDDIEIAATVDDADEDEDEDEDEDDDEDEDEDEDDDEVDEIRRVELKRWQLRRLASALKIGRRKSNIKSLAAELGLERSIVLELLRDPTPELLMMCATMPDEPEPREIVLHPEIIEVVPEMSDKKDAAEPETKGKELPHVKQQRWSAQKRLKKVQVQTMENVYRRTKRPTNAMISSIVQVTSLPRKRIVKWFEDKRAEDGVPDQRRPYQKPAPETVSSP